MLRSLQQIVAAVAVLAVGGQVFGQEHIVSYSADIAPGGQVGVGTAPAGGFILTDIISADPTVDYVVFEDGVKKAILRATISSLHLSSGIAFNANSNITISHGSASTVFVMLGGHLQTPAPSSGNVPAVSQWGLIIMSLLILAGGTILISRRRATA